MEELDFRYTAVSLNDVYETGTKHALQVLAKNGVDTGGDTLEISAPEIKPVALEVGFEDHFPVERNGIGKNLSSENPSVEVEFTGNGFVVTGSAQKTKTEAPDAEMQLEMTIDGGVAESFVMPTAFAKRRHEVAWKYQLPEGKHVVKITLKNPAPGYRVGVNDILVYSSQKIKNTWKGQ